MVAMVIDVILSRVTELSWVSMLLICLALTMAYSYCVKKPWLNLPPGPPSLPLLGSGPFVVMCSWDIRKAFVRLAAYYGDVLTVYLVHDRVIVLNGYDVIKEAMMKCGSAFNGRPDIFPIRAISNNGYGIIGTQGTLWREQRRYVIHVLKNFGFGKNKMEEMITTGATCLVSELKAKTNTPINPREYFAKAVSNVVTLLAFGERRSYDDPLFNKFMKIVAEVVVQIGGPRALNLYPSLRFIPGIRRLIGYDRLQNNLEYLNSHYRQWIDDHKQKMASGQQPTDLIGSYLVELEKKREEPDSTFSESELMGIISDLFLAGTDTTSLTLSWVVLYMILYPDIQRKVHNEIHDAIGPDHVVRWEDRGKLPYTEAVIAEVMRRSNVIPLVAPHATLEDVTFRGYHIPKGTMVLINGYSVDMDPRIWNDPSKFNPSRFIDVNGQYCRKEEQFTFGMGKRACIGEVLARIEIFLFFVTIMQKFTLKVPPGEPVPDVNGVNSATYQPKPFNITIENYR